MPIYEFYSPETHRIYSFFARSLSQGAGVPRCPDDPKARMERLISSFAVTGRTKKGDAPPLDNEMAAPDPRMQQVMSEMEKEISTMSDDRPDPRQLGRLMRKMSEATGEKMPGPMEEMIRRLEKGEDPEKIESEYSDVMQDLEGVFSEKADAEGKGLPTRRRVPSRDPKLYEMSDYL